MSYQLLITSSRQVVENLLCCSVLHEVTAFFPCFNSVKNVFRINLTAQ